jgi:hypothetical protein
LNSNAAGGNFCELYNYGTTPIDLTGWKWDDDSASNIDAGVATFPTLVLAAGQRVIISNVAAGEVAFRAAWGFAQPAAATAIGSPGV